MTSDPIAGRFDDVRARIEKACTRVGRSPDEVRIVAVTKTWPPDIVIAAQHAGLTDVGENRAQELKQKVSLVGDRVRWHFIGHLQTNKVRQVVGSVVLVHSVDRYALAEAIARRATSLGISQDVLVEVNAAGETSKQGIEPARALDLAREISSMEGLAVKGLMTMPPYDADPEASRPFFKDLAALGEGLAAEIPVATELSMGMSSDFEVAVEEGATLVRLGEVLFGPRRSR